MSSEQCVNVIFISINLNGRKKCARKRESESVCAHVYFIREKGEEKWRAERGREKASTLVSVPLLMHTEQG